MKIEIPDGDEEELLREIADVLWRGDIGYIGTQRLRRASKRRPALYRLYVALRKEEDGI